MHDRAQKNTFHFFVGGSAAALFGSEIFYFIVPLVVLSLGYSPVIAGWCSFAFFAPVIGGKLLAGPFVERRNKRSVLLSVEACRLITLILLAFGLYVSSAFAIPLIFAAALIMGSLNVFSDTAEPGVLKQLLEGQHQANGLAFYEIRTRTVQLLGPTIGGLALSVTMFMPIIVSQVCSIIAIICYSCVEVKNKPVPSTERFWKSLGSAFNWMRHNRLFFRMVLLTSLNNFIHPVLYLTVVYNAHESGYEPEQIGIILAGLGAGGIIGSIASPILSRNLTTQQIVLLVNIARVFIFLGFALSFSPAVIFVLFMGKAILGGSWNVCYNVYTIGAMPHDYISRVSSLSTLIIKCFTAFGSLLAGYSISLLGSVTTLWALVFLTVFMLLSSIGISKESFRSER